MLDKKNIPLVVGLLIPVVLVIVIALSIYLPRLWAPVPQYDFVYVLGQDRYGPGYYFYEVQDGKVKRHERAAASQLPQWEVAPHEPRLYLHDIETNSSKELTLEEAQSYSLQDSSLSPDGFQVACGRSSGMVLFVVFDSHSDCSRRYLEGHHTSSKLNLWNNANDNYYYYNFQFLGWVMP